MRAAILGPDTIAVNDSVQAGKDFEKVEQVWLKERGITDPEYLERIQEYRKINDNLRKEFEDKMARDLESQGFKVVRIAGSFSYIPEVGYHGNYYLTSPIFEVMNFFNIVTARTAKNEKIVVAMGVISEDYRKKFEDMLKKAESIQVDRIYYIDWEMSKINLFHMAGISCRIKTL